jgi:hypothetical protein
LRKTLPRAKQKQRKVELSFESFVDQKTYSGHGKRFLSKRLQKRLSDRKKLLPRAKRNNVPKAVEDLDVRRILRNSKNVFLTGRFLTADIDAF